MSKSVSTFVCILGLVHIKGFMCQLTPAVSEHDYCLGEMVTFTCTQRIGRIDGRTHDSLSWAIGTSQLTFVAGLDPPGDSELLQPFAQNQMIGFEAIVDSVTPNTLLQSSLRVMMPMELNGLSIRCEGESVYQTAAINVTSSVPLSPQSILATDIQNNSDSSIVTLRWDVPVGAAVDNYSVAIDPVPSSGAPPTATSTQSTVTVLYNINYAISITAVNCIGSGATASTRITLVNCFSPMAASGVVVEPHSATTQGAVINYFCQQSPSERLMSVCGDDGRWNPDLQVHICVTSTPPTPVACSRPPPPANGSVGEIVRIGEGYEVTFQCDDGLFPTGQFIARCVSDGMWSPDPAEVECSAEFFNCSSPPPPTNGFIGNVTSVSVMFGCNEGFTPRTSMTAVCVGVNMWKPDPSEFLCSPEKSQGSGPPQLTCGAAVSLASVVCFISGGVLGMLCLYIISRCNQLHASDHENDQHVSQPAVPVYEDVCTTSRDRQIIELSENVAYRPIKAR